MAENVPIQPLNRLSLPIFHVTNSGLEKQTQEILIKKAEYNLCAAKRTTVIEDLSQSHDFHNPEYFFLNNHKKDSLAELYFLLFS